MTIFVIFSPLFGFLNTPLLRTTEVIITLWSNNFSSIDVKMNGSVVEKKSSFKKLGLSFPSKLDWGSYIIPIVKTASMKIRTLIRF